MVENMGPIVGNSLQNPHETLFIVSTLDALDPLEGG